MNYRMRHAESRLMKYARTFKVVLVTGARQVGKSTMLAHAFPEAKSVVFDPLQDILGAESDPDLFLENMGTPLILDEIQYAPRLLPALKRRVDRSGRKGQYFLTGSQHPSILRSVSESMAGRVGILQLEGMTPQEMRGEAGVRGWLGAWLKEPGKFASRIGGVNRARGPLVRDIWRGQLPGLLDEPDDMVFDYYRSYIQTYIERDARLLDNIRDLSSFSRLTGLAAALTAQEVNTAKFGRDVGVMPATARAWLDVLAHTYQWLELDAYSGNTVKRLSGKKKGHMSDTGVACALQRVTSPEALAVHPLLGVLFATMVVGMLRAQFATLAVPWDATVRTGHN